ncbi:MAG: ferredoxin:protochlorophyllide reductase (ATP-dependent) subunit B [Pseudomonadota bacterium]
MRLAVWTYEGPPHVGAMRIATALKDVHYVLHAPQGDTYADLLFTMIERRGARPPVTYTTFEARDLGADTAELFKQSVKEAYQRFKPKAMLVGASCTAELIQDDPGGLGAALGLPIPVIPLELPSYQKKENWGASETLYQIVRRLAGGERKPGALPSCNILGPTALGFRHRDDVKEITRLLEERGLSVNVVAPLGATPDDFARLGEADLNIVLYPEIAEMTARWLKKNFNQPYTTVCPLGVTGTRAFLEEIDSLIPGRSISKDTVSNMPWWSRSIDSNYLTGKQVFVFGEGSRAVAAARVARDELAFEVVGIGCYNREAARDVRATAKDFGVEALITDDYLEVEERIEALQPELILGTQMERHIAKRLGIGCAVISAPVHVQDYPARYSPQLGPEGANVLFDTWVHPLVMGLEEHLLGMFRDDFEFSDAAGPSHLTATPPPANDLMPPKAQDVSKPVLVSSNAAPIAAKDPETSLQRNGEKHGPEYTAAISEQAGPSFVKTDDPAHDVNTQQKMATSLEPRTASWSDDAETELKKIPFFVRGKARRNTEKYALERGLVAITVDTLYEAKAHYGR